MSPMIAPGRGPLLVVAGLCVRFGDAYAVRGAGFSVAPGEVVAIVGESGSGKSVTALAVMGLLPASARVAGSVLLRGSELLGLRDRELAAVRGNDIAMIFQDPAASFTPVRRVGDQIAEAVRIHSRVSRRAAAARAAELLGLAGLPGAARAFPHELSGGQCRRATIAMALAGDPAVILADEPTASLDVTVQAQVLDSLQTVRDRAGAALVLITHDLGVVAGHADRVVVMYAGRPVETGPVDDVYARPRMPYTIGLLGSAPCLAHPGEHPMPIAPPTNTNPPPENARQHDEPQREGRPGSGPQGDALSWSRPSVSAPLSGVSPGDVSSDGASPGGISSGGASSGGVSWGGASSGGVLSDGVSLGCAFAARCPVVVAECRTTEPLLLPVGGPGHRAACLRAADVRSGPARVPRAAVWPPRERRAPVLEVDGLVKHYIKGRAAVVRAVDGIGFDVRAGETLGLVGESGCGKTTALLEILRLGAPQAGRMTVFGRDTAALSAADRRAIRRDLQIVFQDPLAALDPRMRAGAILAEPLRVHGGYDVQTRVPELLRIVGLEPAHASRYPGDLSGGQRQRVGIARALALEPKLLVMDEPFSALDVSVRAGIIDLLGDLRARLGLSYVLASHDLAVVRQLADRVAVMHLGRIAEIGDAGAVFRTPAHPYTRALLSAVPLPDPRAERARRRIVLRDDPPSDRGCRFHHRCPAFALLAAAERRRCTEEEPAVRPVAAGQSAACHHPGAG
jgi:peptide/nickel transport system ATP-binding protein